MTTTIPESLHNYDNGARVIRYKNQSGYDFVSKINGLTKNVYPVLIID